MKRFYLKLLLLFLFPLMGSAEVYLPAIFSSNMVLQQQSQVKVWGWASPGETVKVQGSWMSEPVKTVGNLNATWSVTITTPKSTAPQTLTVNGSNKIVLENVLLGEVWLCAGQSNMEWSAELGVKDAKAELPKAFNNSIRFFDMPKLTATAPQADCKGKWTVCDSATLAKFSAVGYFFGKKLNQSLNVPIGLIDVAWGGTYIETWIPAELINLYPLTAASAEAIPPFTHWPYKAGYIYNGAIAPLTNFTIAGAIWYQGESNRHYPSSYYQLMHQLVESWRAQWQLDFPFYYVQIAPFDYQDKTEFKTAIVRDAQTKAMDIPKSGMVVVTDLVDNLKDIHPAYKLEVGNRLAAWALAETYQQKVPYKSPQFQSLKIEKSKAKLTFINAPNGLIAKGGELTEFEIAGEDKKFVQAKAKITSGGTVEVWSEDVKNPVAVRFAYSDMPVPNLFSKEGLPAIPFRTDNW
jgi:sialate O-acetylesterase